MREGNKKIPIAWIIWRNNAANTTFLLLVADILIACSRGIFNPLTTKGIMARLKNEKRTNNNMMNCKNWNIHGYSRQYRLNIC
jgi:hypothetical protein